MEGKPCLIKPVCITQWQLKYGLVGKVTHDTRFVRFFYVPGIAAIKHTIKASGFSCEVFRKKRG